jgi:acetyl-CoA synthetase
LKSKVFNPSTNFSINAHVKSIDQYLEEYQQSIKSSNEFWASKAERITWSKKWDSIGEYDFVNANIKWFQGGKLHSINMGREES